MYKVVFLGILAFVSGSLFAQSNTEVFLASLDVNDEGVIVSNLMNISKDPGYDNQPSFGTGDMLLFAGNNNGQTDIFQFHSRLGRKIMVDGLASGGEYSPQLSPDQNSITAVRLDTTGLQRLYSYNKGKVSELIPDLVVAYYTYYNADTLVGCYIADEKLNLFVHNLKDKSTQTLLADVGRSFHKVPGQNSVSYSVGNNQDRQDVYLLDMETLESFFVTQLPIGVEDYAWLSDSKLIIGSGHSLFVYDTFGNGDWEKLADLDPTAITNITRLAVSPGAGRIALVGTVPE